MGQYEPDDSRDVTLSNDTVPGEPDRTGPREGETRRDEQSQAKNARPASDDPLQSEGHAQVGYGNSRDTDGTMEQDAKRDSNKDKSGEGDRFVGETSPDPARRAKADAKRPLGSD